MPDLSALQRQRRFLILMSLAVIAFYALGAEVDKAFAFQGAAVKLRNPEGLEQGLWLVWLWAFVRYAQRVYELYHDVGKEILDDVYAEEHRLAVGCAWRRARELTASGKLDEGKYPVMQVFKVVHVPPGGAITEVHPHPAHDFVPLPGGGRRYTNFVAQYLYDTQGNSSGKDSCRLDVEITARHARRLVWRSWYHGAIRLPGIGEHAAPFVLALVAYGTILAGALLPVLF